MGHTDRSALEKTSFPPPPPSIDTLLLSSPLSFCFFLFCLFVCLFKNTGQILKQQLLIIVDAALQIYRPLNLLRDFHMDMEFFQSFSSCYKS